MKAIKLVITKRIEREMKNKIAKFITLIPENELKRFLKVIKSKDNKRKEYTARDWARKIVRFLKVGATNLDEFLSVDINKMLAKSRKVTTIVLINRTKRDSNKWRELVCVYVDCDPVYIDDIINYDATSREKLYKKLNEILELAKQKAIRRFKRLVEKRGEAIKKEGWHDMETYYVKTNKGNAFYAEICREYISERGESYFYAFREVNIDLEEKDLYINITPEERRKLGPLIF